MYALFENIQKSKENELKFQAQIHGATFKEKKHNTDATNNQVPFFSDPKEYNDLSEDEKEKMTENMKKKHMNWVKGGVLK